MKKLVLSAFVFGVIVASNTTTAQLADGSVAPDFTATDINGVSHTLSNYLNAGKTVIIDVSATWCGPCWNYHESHALKNIYEAYGPDGSDEVMVFYVEGDGSTTLADLNGTGTNTQGDWVTGTPYPILDNAAIASSYAITYFPTIYRICPDGFVYEMGQKTATQIVADIAGACGAGAMDGVQNHAAVEGSEIAICAGNPTPEASFTNYGTNAITSATLTLKENGSTVGTANYSGSTAQFASATATFPSMAINQGSTYTVELTSVNSGAPNNASTDGMSVVSANLSSLPITIKVYTDNYPAETTWELKNTVTNAVVASGGPYIGNGTSAGGADAITTKTHTVTLPAGSNCYTIKMMDSYGDGFGYGVNPAGQYGIEVVGAAGTVINLDLTNFGTELVRDAALKTDATSGIQELVIDGFNIYPNPATDNITVAFNAENADYTVAVLDMQGRQVAGNSYTNLSGSQALAIPVNGVASGNYLVKVSSNGVSSVQKVVIR